MTACPCGAEFDAELLGPYGCPSCGGDAAASAAKRQARSRKARAEAGGKQIAVMLTPAAAAKLAAWVAKGETIAGLINRMLTKSRP